MTFMNRGAQNKKQRKVITVISLIIIIAFLLSIIAVAFV
ncbi:hypothetical protein SYNTR_1397 [Candidatus Syntrophocurvum alkaliphilum]|uniref:DUF4044 domain-containing protein n=1 Tax=Candidatus Syntrophocurvum alkaliphilum TaxID=2293317 RepID=A0A6I6DI82_9FIRM|nr:hypothetical protein SYNTR_1397 [Candidatus Syntrophocurvum alkaliphilum]